MVKLGNNDEVGRCALTIFARAPVPGRVKTRVAERVGASRACALYRAMLRDTLALATVAASCVPNCDAWVIFTPDDAFEDGPHSLRPVWDGPHQAQRGSDLGARMLHCLADMRAHGYTRVAIIGSDAPDIPPGLICDAFGTLAAAPAVLGPARDGGYYLIGTSVPLPVEAFADVTWSAPTTLDETRRALGAQGIVPHLLGTWDDVDTFDDLQTLAARLKSGASHAPATAAWLRSEQLL